MASFPEARSRRLHGEVQRPIAILLFNIYYASTSLPFLLLDFRQFVRPFFHDER